jgi:hypothetical protein
MDVMMAEEDARTVLYREYGIVDGTPGSADDQDVMMKLDTIVGSDSCRDDKLEMLDALYFYTVNNHERGCAADVIFDVLGAASRIVCEEADDV